MAKYIIQLDAVGSLNFFNFYMTKSGSSKGKYEVEVSETQVPTMNKLVECGFINVVGSSNTTNNETVKKPITVEKAAEIIFKDILGMDDVPKIEEEQPPKDEIIEEQPPKDEIIEEQSDHVEEQEEEDKTKPAKKPRKKKETEV